MHTVVGNCPHCGGPIYVESVWAGTTPPPNIYSCNCAGRGNVQCITVTTLQSKLYSDPTDRVKSEE